MSALPPGTGVNSGALPPTAEILPVPPFSASLTVPNRPECVRQAVAFLLQHAKTLQIAAAATPLFEVALTEAVTNAVKHGHGGAPEAMIVCEVERSPRQVVFRVTDTGRGFVVPERTLPRINPDEVQQLPEEGYGLPIIQSVFPVVKGIRQHGRFTLELTLPIE